jgi:oxaloacetate decarboxylase (Na+ extruding) subunit gamma
MESNLSNSLLLLLIGMSTVFVILFIVVTGGNFLIRLVNKIELDVHEVPFTKIKTEIISPSKEAAIHAVVNVLTHGKGKVENIEKI